MKLAFAAIIAAILVAACAGDRADAPANNDSYVAGSNIPRRSTPPETQMMSREQMEGLQRSMPGSGSDHL